MKPTRFSIEYCDALASTANFLNKAGWRKTVCLGFEVQITAGMSIDGEGRRRSEKPFKAVGVREE